MFKTYGIIGIILIFLVEINFLLKIEPFASWYFPIVWIGYILVIDALNYKIKGKSLIKNNLLLFVGLFFLSAFFWYAFELLNFSVQNWNYIGSSGESSILRGIFRFLSFATVLPALFETSELIKSIHLFDKVKLKKKLNINKKFLHSTIILGVLCFFLPIIFPKFAFPLVWLSFFLILDPINYIHKQPSIIGFFKKGKLKIPLSLLLAGIILGFLWEFWNYWSVHKWIYNIPYVDFLKIFEMPLLGYLGYFPFAWELYAMYWFTRSLFIKGETQLK
jgi:hypothetical protein